MSIYFEYEVGKTGRSFRRAVEGDKYDIHLILDTSCTDPLFGEVNIGELIELSVLAICMVNEDNRVLGFLALSDHPNVRGVDPSSWEYWVRNLYQRYYLSRNTLFVHFMCCSDEVSDYFLEEALISVFFNDFYLLHIVIVLPIFCPKSILTKHGVFKKRNFFKFMPRGEDKDGNALLTALRQDFCPKLKMRRAVEEDNDDVVEILDKTCPRLKQLYGMYYISEIIGRHPESRRKILVGDIQGRAVTVMCLNTDINYRKLQKLYELKPFYGLISATPLEKEQFKRSNQLLTEFGNPILMGKWHPSQHILKETQSLHALNLSEECLQKTSDHLIPTKKISRVIFKKHAKMRQTLDEIIVKDNDSEEFSGKVSYSPTYSHITLYSVINLLDDDPFDYDIVNIDQNLLKDVSSSDIKPIPSTTSIGKKLTTVGSTKKYVRKAKPSYNKKVSILDQKSSATYQGARNAFMIELFALREDIDERYSFDMLEAAFDFMRDYDYCIIRIPSSERSFPLLQHFCFVPLKQRVCCDYVLYVAHRSSVLGKLRVREAEIIDVPDIATLLYPLEAKETISAVENMIFNGKENQAYVFTSGMSVVGLGILELPEEIDFIRGRFNLDKYQLHKYRYKGNGVDAGFANIRTIIMYPAFEPHYRFFARELMRLSGNNTLMYVSAYRNKWSVHKGNLLVSAMVPLMPRKTEIDRDTVFELKRIGALTKAIMAFSAWFIGRKFTSVPKVNVTTRIVIIGASRTSLGFVKSLLFDQSSTYLTFTSVTLISMSGLPYMRRAKPIAESMFVRYYTNSDKYLKSMPYTYYLNVIQGKLAEITLQEKCVTLTSGNRIYYDVLFLFNGRQYQHPDYMSHLLERDRDVRNSQVPKYFPLSVPRFSDTELQITPDDTPDNVFIVNNVKEAHKALDYVKELCRIGDAKVIVYGATIHAYLCINALLKIKVLPEQIIFVEPFPPEDPKKTRVPVFCNSNVNMTVNEILQSLKITIYRSYYFQSWDCLEDENIIIKANFLSHVNYLQLKCSALFYYGKVGIDMRAYIAIHKSGLSYDGGLVIDHECCTRDPSVYAAGPHTRYHRRYYADTKTHKYFDSYEVGSKLGIRIRNRLDPLFREKVTNSEVGAETSTKTSKQSLDSKPNFMELKKPKVTYCELPGGFKYLEVRSPGSKTPHHYVQSLGYNGFVLETFKKGYFKLHLNKDLYVDGITCLKPGTDSLEKFKYLYGHSSTVLKNVHLRFSTNKLEDLYEFFGAPWAFFLYHDEVEDLFAMSKELFPKGHSSGHTIKEAFHAVSNVGLRSRSSWYTQLLPQGNHEEDPIPSLKESANARIKDNFKKSPYVEVITDYVIDWLSHNDILLPMYLQPWQCKQFSYDQRSNPLFRSVMSDDGED